MEMPSCTPLNGSIGQRMFSYLEKYPKNYDVTFSVGPEKTPVKALKIVLKSSSQVFQREFDDVWEQAVLKEGEGIPLPDLDPVAFQLFIKLMILDTWSVDTLRALKLPSSQLLHLMLICQKYAITDAVESLSELVKEFLQNVHTFVGTKESLQLSQPQLKMILASDELYLNELEVFSYALSWAEEQCNKPGVEVMDENIRLALGDCLYQIRFPTMSIAEFATVTLLKGLLSREEIIEIVQYIGLGASVSQLDDATKQKFKIEKRSTPAVTSKPEGSSAMSVTKVFPVIYAPYLCDGGLRINWFSVNTRIFLLGVGFLGPIDGDSFYDVTVQIKKYSKSDDTLADCTDQMEKRIFARKLKTFYFIFNEPIVLDAIPFDDWKIYYKFYFTLNGRSTRSLQSKWETKRIKDGNVELVIAWKHQMVEILYKI